MRNHVSRIGKHPVVSSHYSSVALPARYHGGPGARRGVARALDTNGALELTIYASGERFVVQPLTLEVAARTEVGRRRKINQDALGMRPDLGIYILVDGMGGHPGRPHQKLDHFDHIEA
jgi:hypothetical protein